MIMNIAKYQLALIGLLFCGFTASAQPTLTEAEKKELARKANQVVITFFDCVKRLGAADLKATTRQKMIESVLDSFTADGTVEERGVQSKTGRIRPARVYLNAIKARGDKVPVLISFDVVDNLTPNELVPRTNPDGTVTYRGSVTVRQFYCQLKASTQPSDNFENDCTYSDVTIKKAIVEITKTPNKLGLNWDIFIKAIVVLSVKKQ
jgi:hypothetical protein